jgi:DNA helicase II / ATP-dependent DNA helicase PcrA
MNPEIIRLVGGAGTGKTSALMAEIDRAVSPFGIEGIGFSSMTCAARHEAAARAVQAFQIPYDEFVSDGWFKTLHAACYRALGISHGQIVSPHDTKWLSEVFGRDLRAPETHSDRRERDDVFEALDAWEYARHTGSDLATASVRRGLSLAVTLPLILRYEMAKRVHHRMDLTDLLCAFIGLDYPSPDSHPRKVAPQGEPPPLSMWLFDECQDMSWLLYQVALRLAAAPTVERVVLGGDPFQSIYGFMGASADHFMGWPAMSQRTLGVSHRCAESILEFGESALRKMRYGYWDRGIRASRSGGTIERARSLQELVGAVNPRDPWFLLARCNYEARAIAAAATAAGIPWQWTRQAQDETVERQRRGFRACVALERGMDIDVNQIACLMGITPQKTQHGELWVRGAKARYSPVAHPGRRFLAEDLEVLGATPLLIKAIKTGTWPTMAKGQAQSFRDAVARYGDDLAMNPPVKIGTIHSVKGAEAPNVGLLHSIPRQRARRQCRSPEEWNEERCIEYVGTTRAKDRLIIATPLKRGAMSVLV